MKTTPEGDNTLRMKYLCIFCHHRSDERNIGCPNCGQRFGYGEVGVIKALQLGQGIVFSLIGGVVLFIGVHILVTELRLPYQMAPWWVFLVIFGAGALFTAGGLSALCGRNWLLSLLLKVFARQFQS